MLSFPKPKIVHDPKVHVDVWTSQMFQRSRMVLQDASLNAFHNLDRKPACSRKLEYIPGVLQRTMIGYDVVFDLVFGNIRPGSSGVRQFRNATASRKDLPVFYPVPSHMARVVVSVPSAPSSQKATCIFCIRSLLVCGIPGGQRLVQPEGRAATAIRAFAPR
jgi:hypothetical protein